MEFLDFPTPSLQFVTEMFDSFILSLDDALESIFPFESFNFIFIIGLTWRG